MFVFLSIQGAVDMIVAGSSSEVAHEAYAVVLEHNKLLVDVARKQIQEKDN